MAADAELAKTVGVCTKFGRFPIQVNLQNGGAFGWTIVSPFGQEMDICFAASKDAFLNAY